MVQAPIELDPDPEPDIRRFSSSNQHNNHHPPGDRALSPNPAAADTHTHTVSHHGAADTRIDVHDHSDYDEKSSNTERLTSATDVTRASSPHPATTGDKLEVGGGGDNVPVSRSSSKRPKVRDFAVANIAQPIKRATEKLVPSKREPGQQDVAFVLPPAVSRPGSPNSAAEAAEVSAAERAKIKFYHGGPGFVQSLKNTLKNCPILYAIPVLLPISWGLEFAHQPDTAIFVTSLLAIVPLAGGLSFATEELAHRMGDAWGGLLNATFGNVVELLIAILALVKGDIDIVQASMVGSILSNVLLVLGMSYFAGGLRFHEQQYGIIGAQMHISLLGITLAAIVLPAAYHYAYPNTSDTVDAVRDPGRQAPLGQELDNLLQMSRGLSFILLAVYGMFLTFQLYTHAYLFRIPRGPPVTHPLPGPKPHHESVFPRPNWVPSIADSSSSSGSSRSSNTAPSRFRRLRRWSKSTRDARSRTDSDDNERAIVDPQSPGINSVLDEEANVRGIELPPPHAAAPDLETTPPDALMRDDDDHFAPPMQVNFWFAIGMLSLMTALAGVTAEWLVGSIDGLTESSGVSREFVGLILLPVVGNATEHFAAVIVSVKDKLNLSMAIAVGSSIQVSLCILPILVLVGWAIGQPMMLFFDTFETITLVISVLLVNFAISDGRTNYLEGFVMMMAWVSIALVCWFYDPIN